MRLKENIRLHGVRPEVVLAIMVVDSIYLEMFKDQYPTGVMITSVSDGKHSETSGHYAGAAFDCRVWFLSPEQVSTLSITIQNLLGPDFFVKVEKDHIHVGWRPRRLSS